MSLAGSQEPCWDFPQTGPGFSLVFLFVVFPILLWCDQNTAVLKAWSLWCYELKFRLLVPSQHSWMTVQQPVLRHQPGCGFFLRPRGSCWICAQAVCTNCVHTVASWSQHQCTHCVPSIGLPVLSTHRPWGLARHMTTLTERLEMYGIGTSLSRLSKHPSFSCDVFPIWLHVGAAHQTFFSSPRPGLHPGTEGEEEQG